MTVAELIEELQRLPSHWPVTVEMIYGSHYSTLDVQPKNLPSQGNMAVIRLGDR